MSVSIGKEDWLQFQIVPNYVLGAEVKKDNPGLYTFDIVDNGKLLGAFTYYPGGAFATYTKSGKMVSIQPDYKSGPGSHTIELGKKTVPFGFCQTDHEGKVYDLSDL